MSTIPLDLERRFEQRWAARFSRPEQAAALQKQRFKVAVNLSTLSSKPRERRAAGA